MMPEPDEGAANSRQSPSFEAGLADLGSLVVSLESGSLGLSESIAAYERGVALLRQLHEELASAEERVSVLVRIDEDGRPIVAARDAGESAAEPTAPARAARAAGRKSRSRNLPGMDGDSDPA